MAPVPGLLRHPGAGGGQGGQCPARQTVSRFSLIRVVSKRYSVPSRLIAHRLRVRLYATADVMPTGLDTQAVRRPIPIEKALEGDTLLVYGMNGQTLPEDHGFPVRVLIPGWIGIANIKWVGKIEVSETPLFSQWNTTLYRFFGEAYPDSPVSSPAATKSAPSS